MFRADFRKNLQACFAKPLKAIRRSPRLVSPTTEQPDAGFFHEGGNRKTLPFGLHGAGPRNHRDVPPADNNLARGRGNPQNAVFCFCVAADQLIRLANRDAFDHPRQRFEDAEVHSALVSCDPDRRANRSRDGMRLQAERFDPLADSADLLLGGMRLHDDKHRRFPGAACKTQVYGMPLAAANCPESSSGLTNLVVEMNLFWTNCIE